MVDMYTGAATVETGGDWTNNVLVPQLLGRSFQQDAQLSQRDRAAGCVIVFPKSRRLQLGDNILRTV